MVCRYVVKEGEGEEATGVPGAPSEQAARWVVGRDESEARAAAEKKYAPFSWFFFLVFLFAT